MCVYTSPCILTENPQVRPVSPVVLLESEGSASSVPSAVELDQTNYKQIIRARPDQSLTGDTGTTHTFFLK